VVDDPKGEVTGFLLAWRQGDRQALDRLFPLVYQQLRRIARQQLARIRPGNTLDTTALIHEAYVKLVDSSRAEFQDRNHFLAVAAKAMRHILVDDARRRHTQKRNAGQPPLPLAEAAAMVAANSDQLLEVDAALTRLEQVDERLGRLVELRFFAGLTVEETAATMEISSRTVKRDWQKARAFLYAQLAASGGPAPGSGP
jgi:RNA polymerase sigma factor (TIGR02999 family)